MIALQCISCYLIIPLPFSMSPISMVTLIVNLNGMLLSAKQSLMSMSAYLLLGLAGLPVFTGGSSGPGKLFGPTGGYLFGWLLAAVLLAYLRPAKYDFCRYAILGCAVGIPAIYLCGCVQLQLLTGMGWTTAFLTGVAPFIPMDVLKVLGAAYLTRQLLPFFR